MCRGRRRTGNSDLQHEFSDIFTFSTETASTTSPQSEKPKGIQVVKIFNRTYAVNVSLVGTYTIECVKTAPDVIKDYYNAVKDKGNVSEYFDLTVVDQESLEELHEALYNAVDFEKLDVSNINCTPVTTQLVACRYHYSAVIVSGNEKMNIERNYVTFLSGDSCKIVWTEAEG